MILFFVSFHVVLFILFDYKYPITNLYTRRTRSILSVIIFVLAYEGSLLMWLLLSHVSLADLILEEAY